MSVTYAVVVVNLPSLLKGKSKTYLVGLMRSPYCLGVAAPFQLQLTDFHETFSGKLYHRRPPHSHTFRFP
jgi:hypothetical protein